MELFLTTMTVFAVIYAVGWSIHIACLFAVFWNLTPLQQAHARINLNGTALIVLILCVSWIVARIVT